MSNYLLHTKYGACTCGNALEELGGNGFTLTKLTGMSEQTPLGELMEAPKPIFEAICNKCSRTGSIMVRDYTV